MSDFFKKNIVKIFMLILLFNPFLDCLVGIFESNNTIVLFDYILRTMFLFIEVVYIILINKKSIKYLLLLAVYLSIFIMVNGDFNNTDLLIKELNMSFKSVYFAINIIFSIYLINNNKIDIKYLIYILVLYVMLIFIPNILNIGVDSYAYSKSGSVGLYRSANSVGNIISIIFPIFMYYLTENPKNKLLYVFLIIYFYVIFNIGTKAPIIFSLLVFLYYLILLIIKFIKRKDLKSLTIMFLSGILVIFVVINVLPLTPFYDNILLHLDYLKIDEISDLFNFKKLDNFIFGDRFKFFINSFNDYGKSDIIHKIFGIGYVIDNNIVKTSEMDVFVIFIHQGIFGLLVIFSLYFERIFEIIRILVIKFKTIFIDKKKMSLILSVIISFLCLIFIGHVVDYVSSFMVVGLIVSYCYKELG